MNALNLYKTRQIGFFAMGGMLSALFYTLMEGMILYGSNSITDCQADAIMGALINLVFGAFIGAGVGIFEVFIFHKSMARNKFGKLLCMKSIIYLLLFTCSAIMIAFTHAMNDLGLPLTNPAVILQVKTIFKSVYFPLFLLYVTISVTGLIFLHQMSEKLGNGVLWQFLLGKYHHPQQEQRAFMFIDMKDSTSIAERLGHQKFYELLNDFFADMTDTILRYHGEIYQYVGDEIIITWQIGQQDQSSIIHCFFEIERAIQRKAKSYIKKYGFVPEFKAGVHAGQVTLGEVGTIKREIVFSGDVLNTTSRIQGLCNQYQAKLLISDQLYRLLPQLGEQMLVDSIGKVSLKGKAEQVGILKITEKYAPVYQAKWDETVVPTLGMQPLS